MSTYILSPKNKGMSDNKYVPSLSAYLFIISKESFLQILTSGQTVETSLVIIRHRLQTPHSVTCICRDGQTRQLFRPPCGDNGAGRVAATGAGLRGRDWPWNWTQHSGWNCFHNAGCWPSARVPREELVCCPQSAETLRQPQVRLQTLP